MVDFIDLAESSRWLIERILSKGDNNDDDFVNLEVSDAGGGDATRNDGILNSFVYGSSSQQQQPPSPFLSKSAEAELYLLCTNFLLYVAMVIITTIIAKIYFPETLQRDNTAVTRRKYSYRRHQPRDHDDDDDDGFAASPSYADEEDDEMEALYSDEEGEDEDGSGDLFDPPQGDFPPTHSPTHQSAHPDPLGLGATTPQSSRGQRSVASHRSVDHQTLFSDTSSVRRTAQFTARVLEFDQEQTSRPKVIQRLLLCCLMLNITFVTWGALQERMLTRRYPRHTGDYFTYSYALVFTNRFWTLVMSGILLWYLKPRLSRSTVIYEFSFPSISNMLSSWCQYEALRYVSFPATTLFKSFKLAPVMLMGKFLGNKSCKYYLRAVLFESITLY
jgi:hypothetical protein